MSGQPTAGNVKGGAQERYDAPDWYLRVLVNAVNGSEMALPVTLFVGGLVVSGKLVSGHRYFAGLREQLTQFFGGKGVADEETLDSFTSEGQNYKAEKNADDPLPFYIHLEAAKEFAPGQQPIPTDGTWWRGRLASVDAFHFGQLAESTAK